MNNHVILERDQAQAMINYLDAFSDMMTAKKGTLEFLLSLPALPQAETAASMQRSLEAINEHLGYFAEFSSQLQAAQDDAVNMPYSPKLEVLK